MSAMVLRREMAADDEHMKDPDFSYVFNEVTLGSVQPNFRYLTMEQQRRQMSSVFQAHGLYWVMAIEKYGSDDSQPDKCDIHVYLYCLSVPIDEECRENFVIKGDICSGDHHVFNGEAGRAFNLPGKSYPAEAVRFKNKVVFRLTCGDIDEEVEMWAPAAVEVNQDSKNKFDGVWYDGKWTGGIGVCPLKNYFLDTEANTYSEQIEVSVKFELPVPFAVIESGLLANNELSVSEVAKVKDGDDEEVEMDVDEDNSTDHPLGQWERIVNDAENCSDEDLSFNIDEVDELSDEELDIDIESDEESDDLEMKPDGYKPDITMGSLSEASKALLTWREGEFSDWKIKVVSTVEDCETSVIYNVHRVILATGPKKSGYFEALFKSERFKENTESMSTVALPTHAAAQLPDFLDFMYCQPLESKFIVTSENWKSMKYLADYFIVPALTDDVVKVIENEMYNIDRLGGYLSEFSGKCDDFSKRMIPIATRVCAEMIQSIKINSSLLTTISPAMFLHIISTLGCSECFERASNEERFHVSLLVLQYLEEVEDKLYFATLSGAFGLVFFPDDTKLSGELALKWFTLMKRKDWYDEWISFVCTSSLQRYLADRVGHPEHLSLVGRVTEEVPAKISAALLYLALCSNGAKKATIPELRFQVDCDIFDYREGVLPSVSTNTTIPELKIKIARILGLLSSSWEMTLTHAGTEMKGTISSYKDANKIRTWNVITVKVYPFREIKGF
jgi:hypothetical protein